MPAVFNIHSIPRVLKDPLADFLNVPIGTMMTYRDIVFAISRYIDNNNLLNRRTYRISPNNCLCNLFGIQPDETIKYIHLAYYIFDLVE